jgi:hypothetical protein
MVQVKLAIILYIFLMIAVAIIIFWVRVNEHRLVGVTAFAR